MAKVWPVHYVLGMAGIGVIRNWLVGDDSAKTAFDQLAALTRRFSEDRSLQFQLDISDLGVTDGYRMWADTYDDLRNPLINIERPAIEPLLARIPAGRALDAACGTGRYARYMLARGHAVTAVDLTPGMLERARGAAPEASYSAGRLEALPFKSESFDLVMCGLALTHLPTIASAIAELARVLKRGGKMIISDHHPMAGFLGGSAIFQDKTRYYRNVKSYVHFHGEYVSAITDAGLLIRECLEPEITAEEIEQGVLYSISPEAYKSGAIGMPTALIWLLEREP